MVGRGECVGGKREVDCTLHGMKIRGECVCVCERDVDSSLHRMNIRVSV